MNTAIALAGVLAVLRSATAAETPLPEGGSEILRNGNFKADDTIPRYWKTPGRGDLGTMSILPAAPGEPSAILAIEVKQAGVNPWALQLRQAYAEACGEGTVVWRMGSRGRKAAQEIEALFGQVFEDVMR